MRPPAQHQQQQPEPAHRRASSSTCSTVPRRTVGCIAGLLRLFSPYHRGHHRKRLTAKNDAKQPASSPAPSPPPSSTPKKKAEASSPPPPAFLSPAKPRPMQQQPAAARRRRSCDAPRSPTIAPEHRRSSCDGSRPPPSPPAIVARLMGLEESAPCSPAAAPRPVLPTRPPPPPPPSQPETAAEKRRKLLGALEKCDEDLKMMRRIIAAVRAAEMRAAAASDVVVPVPATRKTPPGSKSAYKWVPGRDDQSPQPQHKPRGEEQYRHPSPDSVLDAISSPRFPCRKRPSPCADHGAGSKAGCGNSAVVPTSAGTKIVKPSRTFVFSGDYCKMIKTGDELQPHTAVGAHHHAVVVATQACTFRPRLPRAAGAESWRHHRRRWELEAAAAGRVIGRAVVESVGEAWGQQACGAADEQRWERGRVAAALERAIMQDLVSDVVAGLLAQSGHGHLGTGCRKRLCF